jgi:urea transport system permease protein
MPKFRSETPGKNFKDASVTAGRSLECGGKPPLCGLAELAPRGGNTARGSLSSPSARSKLRLPQSDGKPSHSRLRPAHWALVLSFFLSLFLVPTSAETKRELVAKAIAIEDGAQQRQFIRAMAKEESPEIGALLEQWKNSEIFIYEADGVKTLITLDPKKNPKDDAETQLAHKFLTGEAMKDAEGKPLLLLASDLNSAECDSVTRSAMKVVLDRIRLNSPEDKERLLLAEMMGAEQKKIRIPILQARLAKETNGRVQRALTGGIAITQLKLKKLKPDGTEDTSDYDDDEELQDYDEKTRAEAKIEASDEVKIAACNTLGEMGYINAQDVLKQVAAAPVNPPVKVAAEAALRKIAEHLSFVNGAGTVFRGISSASVLLIAAIGLAITFGLMGVINMAHGEMIAIGAYTTYVVQCVFGVGFEASPFGMHFSIPGLNLQNSPSFGWYFVAALPLSFLVAAAAGLVLERSVIRFLYRRPLESLLATWGVSLVLQQLFKLTFGSNNVSVTSPTWLSGSWSWHDVGIGWNRVFVIGFAIAIVAGTQVLLRKTPLGLLIRSVMQNRQMAACMGVRTERVNMLTFAFGSGLAGLAGAFVSQLGTVGPRMGQEYIVDNFMTVVVGGVGNLLGTVLSALGIGMANQSLEQYLGNSVLGKIIVLGAIILFLQWKPAGLFTTKSRSLES